LNEFNRQALEYAIQYQAALEQEYPYVLHFWNLRNAPANSTYRWTHGNTIRIPTVATSGRVDSDRDIITDARRNYNVTWRSYELNFERIWKSLIDPIDIDETNMAATIRNITQTFNESQKFPEMDAYLVSKCYADWLALGGVANTQAVTAANVLSIFQQFVEEMDEGRVPPTGRVLYVTPRVSRLLREADAIDRTIELRNRATRITTMITDIDSVRLEMVPSNLMRTLYNFTNGARPAANAGQINMFLGHNSAVATPVKYEFVNISEPTAITDGKFVYFERSYEDVFVLQHKVDGLKFNVTAS